jgi:Transcription factor WhiB
VTTTEEAIDIEVEDLAHHLTQILCVVSGIPYDSPMVAQGEEWKEQAACKGLSHIFYPEDDHSHRGNLYDAARRVCARCPVIDECAEAGKREKHGCWAGKSPVERFPKRRRWGA